MFMIAFVRRVLTSSPFFRLVPKFVKQNRREHLQRRLNPIKASRITIPFTNSSLSSSNYSAEDKARKHKQQNSLESNLFQDYSKFRMEQHKHNKPYSYWSSSMTIHMLPSSSDQDSAQSNTPKLDLYYNAQKSNLREDTFIVFQTFNKHYIVEVEYRTYRHANRFPRHPDSLSSYVPKLIKRVKWQMKAYFFDQKDPISIIGFLAAATFKFPCDTNIIQKEAFTWVRTQNASKTPTPRLNIRMSAQN